MKKTKTILAMLLLSFMFIKPALAFPTLIPADCLGDQLKSFSSSQGRDGDGVCDLADVEIMAVNVAQILVGIIGALILLMFVIGGILYITSSGDSGKIKKANSIIISSVIGLIIVLFAGVAIKLVLKVLTGV